MISSLNLFAGERVHLGHRLLGGVDLVLGEGFKYEGGVPKIEVVRRKEDILPPDIRGIIARVSDLDIPGDYVFRFDETREIAEFIEQRLVASQSLPRQILVDGCRLPDQGVCSQGLGPVQVTGL